MQGLAFHQPSNFSAALGRVALLTFDIFLNALFLLSSARLIKMSD